MGGNLRVNTHDVYDTYHYIKKTTFVSVIAWCLENCDKPTAGRCMSIYATLHLLVRVVAPWA